MLQRYNYNIMMAGDSSCTKHRCIKLPEATVELWTLAQTITPRVKERVPACTTNVSKDE